MSHRGHRGTGGTVGSGLRQTAERRAQPIHAVVEGSLAMLDHTVAVDAQQVAGEEARAPHGAGHRLDAEGW
jgi:hypothetical protein